MVIVGGCHSIHHPNIDACNVARGRAADAQILFHALQRSTTLTSEVHLTIQGSVYPWDVGRSANVCRSLVRGHCPANVGAQLIHQLRLPIPPGVRSGTPATAQIRTYNQERRVQVCVQVRLIMN